MAAATARRRQSPARRRARRRPRRAGAVWLTAAALAVVIVGIGALKWARTHRGRAALLSLGSEHMYGNVQDAVDAALATALPGLKAGPAGPPDPAAPDRDCDWPAPDLGPGAAVRCRTVAVNGDDGWWAVQERLEAALAPAGARVLWGERLAGTRPGRGRPPTPDEATDLLRLDVGVPGRPTHTLVLHRTGRTPPVVWGGGGNGDAWRSLAAETGPVVALVIDDWGTRPDEAAERLGDLPVPLTLAIVPGLSFSRHVALQRTGLVLPPEAAGDDGALRRARRRAGCVVPVAVRTGAARGTVRRRETILELPMQPASYPRTDPGPRALMLGMDRDQVAARVDAALAGLPGISGLSNQMGSAATADRGLMDNLMAVLAERGLLFVDSVTTPGTVACARAREAGVPAAQSALFLDDAADPGRIAANLDRLVRQARAEGFALGMARPRPATADVLTRELPRLAQAGVRFVTVSEYLALRRAAGREE